MLLVALGLTLAGAGCATATPAPTAPAHDTPAPAGEPRAEIELRLSLAQRERCEETFDLELYRERGVEQIAWQEPHGVCQDRVVTVRYLTSRIERGPLMDHIRRLAVKVEELK
ncbi:MAG: hypothetical protein KIT72_04685 [Polyangiaceae bacterium]|nr:hypothetical protein [Polyangiaceae bacterium]MCW5789700.1 hypothetical protein [Polyangiaceae bacterium]